MPTNYYSFIVCVLFLNSFAIAQCPEDIEVANDPGMCGAIVTYETPEENTSGTSQNLITNGDASDGLNNWTVLDTGGDGWNVQDQDGTNVFVNSYAACSKYQIITLADEGFSDAVMDTEPEIHIAEDYIGTSVNTDDTYFLTVELRDEDDDVIDSYSTGNLTTSATFQTASHTFSNYGSGVRSIYFLHGGQDAEFWAGNYGSGMTNAEVTIETSNVTIEQIAGLASGEEFPMGTTTNTFEITEDDEDPETCSFEVVVLDEEAPEVMADNITIEIEESTTITLIPEDIDSGSTDNCEIATYEISPENFTCDELGENEVTLTVTDASGNSSETNVTVTITDPEGYCELAAKNYAHQKPVIYPNPTYGELHISSKNHPFTTVSLYDINGKQIKREVFNVSRQNYNNDLSSFPEGVYFIHITSQTSTSVQRIVKR